MSRRVSRKMATRLATDGVDGMVSLEVSPDLAHDTEATIREAHALHARLNRPNLMIKVPATQAGLPAIKQLIAEGFNINVTLLFSIERYQAVAQAYLRGLERRLSQGEPIERIASVASFFISRVDSALDPLLAERQPELQGKIAIANAKLAYQRFKEIFNGKRFAALKKAGARPQRLLWASTSTKNPDYPELLYVETLIGPQTVNTMPPATYEAFREYGTVAQTLEEDVAGAIVLWSMGAREVSPTQAPDVHATIDRLGALADLPKPRVALVDTSIPNAFATGRNPKAARNEAGLF